MSSLAAARADNFYYPKEWRPEDGSLNKFHGSHGALGKRAKQLASDGILVVRFEMPFNVWCLHCECHIGRGVRYNAKKKQVGKYFTTPLYAFSLRCAQCKGELVIETDPQNRGYKLVSGLKKQSKQGDDDDDGDHGEQDNEEEEELLTTERLNDPEIALRTAADPFFKLEHENHDQTIAKKRAKGLEAVQKVQDAQFKDDYSSNAALRAAFRSKKSHLQGNKARADALGLGIRLLDAAESDIAHSKAILYQGIHGNKRQKIQESNKSRNQGEERVDCFQFFGDPKASQLHQLKKKKMENERKTHRNATAVRTVSRPKTPQDHVMARAKKLLVSQRR